MFKNDVRKSGNSGGVSPYSDVPKGPSAEARGGEGGDDALTLCMFQTHF